MTKIPCKDCGALILPATAKKTGGLCMPCKKGTRKSMEADKAYYAAQLEEQREQMKTSSERALAWTKSTKASLHGVTVNICNAPAFMGHEEIVIQMLVLGGSRMPDAADKLGDFRHCLNDDFQPNDLSNTTVCGATSGLRGELIPPVNLKRMFVGKYDEWKHEHPSHRRRQFPKALAVAIRGRLCRHLDGWGDKFALGRTSRE